MLVAVQLSVLGLYLPPSEFHAVFFFSISAIA
jgi:hypothetical protein